MPDFGVIVGQESINGVWQYLWVAKWPFSEDQTVESCPNAMIPYQYYNMLGNRMLVAGDNNKYYFESAGIVPFLPSQ